MCGIAGIFGKSAHDGDLLRRMGSALQHRGPDDAGVWSDPDANIGFAHRRLAIVDLTAEGHQPMLSDDGRWVICFNGEIYNHRALRQSLDEGGHTPLGGWRGHSDTETLLQCIAVQGIEEAVRRAVGMFALAVWDRAERRLHLARDRFGEKPLYIGWVGGDLLFASELKSFRQHPDFKPEIDVDAIAVYLSLTYIPAPLSIYRGVMKLPPATILSIKSGAPLRDLRSLLSGGAEAGYELRRYWNYRSVVEEGAAEPADLDRLQSVLGTAVAEQLIADVPVGIFLSGGIDSSLVAALATDRTSASVSTFTIGFSEPAYDESGHARAIASHLGTAHHDLIVTPDEARDVIPSLPDIYDEPFADSSQIPTYLVSRFARSSVKVALSGDGGDELFAGYNRHVLAPRAWSRMGRVPSTLRRLGGGALAQLPAGLWSAGVGIAARDRRIGSKIRKGLQVMAGAETIADVYASMLDEQFGMRSALKDGRRWTFDPPPLDHPLADPVRLAYWDALQYLPDDILTKVDRASMAVGLECRAPFLDRRVAEVAAAIPVSQKVDHRGGKAVLRDLLGRYVPASLYERPKQGFGIPVGPWLRGPLRDWAEDLLAESSLSSSGWFNVSEVRRRWSEHRSGHRDYTASLWAILMFESWRRRH